MFTHDDVYTRLTPLLNNSPAAQPGPQLAYHNCLLRGPAMVLPLSRRPSFLEKQERQPHRLWPADGRGGALRGIHNRDAEQVGAAVALVCGEQDGFRETLTLAGGTSPLDAVLDCLRNAGQGDADLGTRLNALHAALQAAGDARGLFGSLRHSGPRPAGFTASPASPQEEIYLCPGRRCPRWHFPQDAPGGAPHCAIDQAPMIKRPL
ncbi:hypothetical protein ACWEPI_35250 [Streptomyces sp. NPDC004262]